MNADLKWTPDMGDQLERILEDKRVALVKRLASGRVSLFRRPANFESVVKCPAKTFVDLTPEEAVIFGLAIMIQGAIECPDFSEKIRGNTFSAVGKEGAVVSGDTPS